MLYSAHKKPDFVVFFVKRSGGKTVNSVEMSKAKPQFVTLSTLIDPSAIAFDYSNSNSLDERTNNMADDS